MLQGHTVSSRLDSDDYDDLVALSCDICAEQVGTFSIKFMQSRVFKKAFRFQIQPKQIISFQATCTYAKELFDYLDVGRDGVFRPEESLTFQSMMVGYFLF